MNPNKENIKIKQLRTHTQEELNKIKQQEIANLVKEKIQKALI